MLKQTLRRWFGVVTTEINQNEAKLDRLIELVNGLGRSQRTILQTLRTLETSAMAKLKEILEAQEAGGKIIVDALAATGDLLTTIASETADVSATIEQIKSGQVPLADLDGVLSTIQTQSAKLSQVTADVFKARESVQAIVPTLITPVEPTPVPTPTPDPIVVPPVEVVPAPTTPEDVVIEITPDDVALPDVPAIDVAV